MTENEVIPLTMQNITTSKAVRGGDETEARETKYEKVKPIDLDDVLVHEIGEFGRYQIKNILLVSLPMLMSAFSSEYIFSAAAIPHRCQIVECGENGKTFEFQPNWITNAIPETNSGFSSCQRFVSEGTNGSLDYCPADMFDRDKVVSCDGYVYGKNNSVVYDFDLGCKEWIRVLAGTLNRAGTFLALPLTSYFSDRFGRRLALIVSTFNFALFGTLRAFSANYNMYLVLHFLQTALGTGLYSSAYIFAAELVGPKYRVLTGAICPSTYAVGLMLLGGIAWLIQSWRYMILVLHIPCFIIVTYYWILDESVRWLLSKKKYTLTIIALEKVAEVNRTKVSKNSMEALINAPLALKRKTDGPGLITSILKSSVLLRRVCTIPFWWIATTFVYHGFSINSTTLSDTMYLNFILTCGVEIPGNFAAIFVLDRIGRKPTLSGGFLLCAACNVVLLLLSNDYVVCRLILYLMGKFGISVVVTSLYLFTSELYPTEYRHSLLGFSSMIGRVGSIVAPLTPALMPNRRMWEMSKDVEFQPEWINNAIPETNSGVSSCQRYESLSSNGSVDYCPADMFNKDKVVACEGFVYGKNNSVVYEFDLGCQEWMRALAGTLSSIGTLLVLPITGYISDRFGRRMALVINIFNFALFGTIRAFSTNYSMYLVLQLLQTTLGAGLYSSSYIFAAELVGPKYRVLTGAICPSMFATGLMVLGAVAWVIPPWRYMILALHVPVFLTVSYYWILGESVRWLLSKQKYTQARSALQEVARVNKTTISEKSLEALVNPPAEMTNQSPHRAGLISSVLSSRVLLRRVCTTPFWWVAATFVYYGLSINSTGLSSAMHLNYILTCGIEIPGYFAATLVLDRIGRKPTLSGGYFLSVVCNLAFAFLPKDLTILRLLIYLLGKFGISVVMTSMYLFTSELYPTEYRHSLLAFSSMIGRIGSVCAPLTPALMVYWEGIPSVLFAGMGLLAGLLVLTQPETLGTKLPDTLAEAEALGEPITKQSASRISANNT